MSDTQLQKLDDIVAALNRVDGSINSLRMRVEQILTIVQSSAIEAQQQKVAQQMKSSQGTPG
jgi:hypothetical protein